MSEKHILLADPNARTAEELRQALGEGWIVNSVETGAAALRELRAQAYDGLVTGLHLADMPPKQLLNRVRTKFPKIIRFIVASEEDRELLVKEALGAHQFLIRPFDADGLRATIEGALATDRWLESEPLRKLVARMRSLPTLPALYLEIVAALKSPNTTTEDVGGLIGQDMAITTKLLQVINSAYFGLPRTVTSPAEAVTLLGFETAKSMVLAVKLLNQYDRIHTGGFSIDALWQHSTAVANSARQLVLLQTGERGLAEAAFTAGLLHDVGKAVLAGNFGEQYAGADSLARKQHLPFCEVEKEIFGAHHGEVGAYLLSLWGLPGSVLEAAAMHHDPARSNDQTFTLLTAVHVADALQYVANPDPLGHVAPTLNLGYLESIGMNECLSSWCEELLGAEAAARFLQVEQTPAPASVPQPGLAFSPPPASLVCADDVAAESRAAGPDDPAAPVEEPCVAEANKAFEIAPAAEPAEIQCEASAPDFGTVSPAGPSVPQDVAPPISSAVRPNRWLVAAGLPALCLLVVCVMLGRLVRDGQNSVPVQAREPQTGQAEPAGPAAVAEHEAPNEPKISPIDLASSSNSVPAPSATLDSTADSSKLAPDLAVKPAPVTKPSFPALKLQGIFYSPQHPSAILNGTLVRQNDRVDGARVVEIKPTTVTLEFQKERRILALE
jgi:putative nucleotidyltransferase with HDIG domain